MSKNELKDIAMKYALKNAFDYGKANLKAVLSKVIKEIGIEKQEIKDIIPIVKEVIDKVNNMNKQDIEEKLKQYSFVEVKKERKLLHDVEGIVITRFPPEPSGYLHIGHAKAVFLDYESAKEHNGYMLLRFDDTNPKKESWEYVNAIKEDLQWLGVKWKRISYTSDYMELLYNKAEELISKGYLYIATEQSKEIKEARRNKKALKSRSNSIKENKELWNALLNNEFKEGEAVVLLKGDMKSDNTALRDPTMFRIIEHEHYKLKNKYKVFPTYDFAAPIIDSIEGVTHAMRSKEYELRKELYYLILDMLNMRKPKLIHFSRLNIKNALVSKRLITPLVKSGKVWGWDDPRLLTLRGLRRRGIQPLAIKNFALRFGIGKQEKTIDLSFLYKENRKVLDPIAKRYMFIKHPIKIKIDFEGVIELPLHPSNNLGKRKIKVDKAVYVEKEDLALNNAYLKGLGLFNLKTGKALDGLGKVIHWVSGSDYINAKLLVPNGMDLETFNGVAESSIKDVKESEVIQFERIGFVRLDKKEDYTFIFTS